jgi:hypothetical protein
MNTNLVIRKTHRYLGLFIGIQFLGWTISGIYFSWNNLDNVHGDHMRKSPHYMKADLKVVSPSEALKGLASTTTVDSVRSVNLINILEIPLYQIGYFSGHTGEGSHLHIHYALADATTGIIRDALSKDEAVLVARDNVLPTAKVEEVRYLQKVDSHHEFRESPLPAYAVSFSNPDCTVYVSTERGTFQTIRHDQWRAFDFLWMFHTMDYEGRDNFNNWLLKSFSVLGLVTVLSGFILFVISSKTIKKITN